MSRLFMDAVVIPTKRSRETDKESENEQSKAKRPIPPARRPLAKSPSPQAGSILRYLSPTSPSSSSSKQPRAPPPPPPAWYSPQRFSKIFGTPKSQAGSPSGNSSTIIDLSDGSPPPVKPALKSSPAIELSPKIPGDQMKTTWEDPPLLPGPILLPRDPQPDYSKVRPSPYVSLEEQRRRARAADAFIRADLLSYSSYFTASKVRIDLRHRPRANGPLQFRYFRPYFHFLRGNKPRLSSSVHAWDSGFDASCDCRGISTSGCAGPNTKHPHPRLHCGCASDAAADTPVARIFPYLPDGRLHAAWLECAQPLAIQECNARCECGPACANRVTQRARAFWVCVYYTGDARKWGLKTEASIQRGQFVDSYLGEIIGGQEIVLADERALRRKESFLFDLSHYKYGPDPPWQEQDLYAMNSEYWGNCTAFINHSCEPNLKCFVVRDTHDERIYRLCFFALRDIAPGEELTFDYAVGKAMEGKRGGPNREAVVEGRSRCQCGAAKCRGWLWG